MSRRFLRWFDQSNKHSPTNEDAFETPRGSTRSRIKNIHHWELQNQTNVLEMYGNQTGCFLKHPKDHQKHSKTTVFFLCQDWISNTNPTKTRTLRGLTASCLSLHHETSQSSKLRIYGPSVSYHGHLRGYPPNATQEIGAFFKALQRKGSWWLIIRPFFLLGVWHSLGTLRFRYFHPGFSAGVKFLVLLLNTWSFNKNCPWKVAPIPKEEKDRLTTIILQGCSLDSWEWYM